MPHRRLVKIGETPTLPTISQFLLDMASKQHEEIQRLKSEALSGKLPDPTVPEEHHEKLTPDPWQLHPVRLKKPAKKKPAKKASVKKAGSKKAAKTSKKVVKTKKAASKTGVRKKAAKKAVARKSKR
jgi:adenylate kinase